MLAPIEYNQTEVFEQIKKDVAENDVVVYMKGTASMPMCGFSGFVAQVLQHYNVPFKAINVLEDQVIRQAIKDFNSWPTVPQIFIKGEFIGGCDIVKELHETGELKELLSDLSA